MSINCECWNCAGSGAIPSQGSEPPEDVDGGLVVCPTCAGSGRLGMPPTPAQWVAWSDADTPAHVPQHMDPNHPSYEPGYKGNPQEDD